MTIRTTVRLPEGLHIRAKQKAASEGRTLTDLIEEGLQRVLSAPPPRPHGELPVSKATGGRNPDYAHLTFAEIDELDEIERFRRMDAVDPPRRKSAHLRPAPRRAAS